MYRMRLNVSLCFSWDGQASSRGWSGPKATLGTVRHTLLWHARSRTRATPSRTRVDLGRPSRVWAVSSNESKEKCGFAGLFPNKNPSPFVPIASRRTFFSSILSHLQLLASALNDTAVTVDTEPDAEAPSLPAEEIPSQGACRWRGGQDVAELNRA